MRLAIECDGDEYHGPDRWAHDMARQRALERTGWSFWRCFASTWVLSRDEVVAELVERLEAMGIGALGAATSMPELVERRVWKPRVRPGQKDDVQAVLENAIGGVEIGGGP